MADTCQAYRALIEEAAGRAAVPGGALGAHLDACGACRVFRREREALSSLLGGLGRVAAPDDFEFRLRARMARRAEEKSLLRRFTLAPGLAAAAVAACLLAAAVVYFGRTQPGRQTATNTPAPAASAPAADAAGERAAHVEVASAGVEAEAFDEGGGAHPGGTTKAAAAQGSSSKRSGVRPRRATRESNFGVRAASVIDGQQVAAHAAPQAVAVRTSPETLRVVLRDERGGSYVLPMRSVSFGAQGPVARGVRASDTNREGVW